jgi:predicted RNA-binding Zn-ribbon protein involved in translation (DUF1610 family)
MRTCRGEQKMLARLRRMGSRLIRKSTHLDHEPINKVSIGVLILIDLFVLVNVFGGLGSIAQWPLSPYEEFPCYSAYENYQTADKKDVFTLNAQTIENIVNENPPLLNSFPEQSRRLGRPSNLCDRLTQLERAVDTKANIQIKKQIQQSRTEISGLERENRTLQSQYDSTLLEKIAGQDPSKSINKVSADRIKSEIETNKNKIKVQQAQVKQRQTQLVQDPNAAAYLQLLNDNSAYSKVKEGFKSAEFWYPNKQLLLQTLFLLPLIEIAYIWHSTATRRNRGLQALLSWHLLLIFCIPLLIKIFEFVQFGNLVNILISGIVAILGGLVFIASYALILIIPLLGFGIIKFLQRFVFNAKVQAKNRIQKVRCLQCNSKLRLTDEFCPHCGFEQFMDCSNCHQPTYKFTNFCSTCGHKILMSLPSEST